MDVAGAAKKLNENAEVAKIAAAAAAATTIEAPRDGGPRPGAEMARVPTTRSYRIQGVSKSSTNSNPRGRKSISGGSKDSREEGVVP